MPPELSRRPQRSLSTYSERDYVIGNSTPSALRKIANILTNGTDPKPRPVHQDARNEDESAIVPTEPAELAAPEPMYDWTEVGTQLEERYELPGNDGERYELANTSLSGSNQQTPTPRSLSSPDAVDIPERLIDGDNKSLLAHLGLRKSKGK